MILFSCFHVLGNDTQKFTLQAHFMKLPKLKMKNKDEAYILLYFRTNELVSLYILYSYDLWTLFCTIRAQFFCSYFFDPWRILWRQSELLKVNVKNKTEIETFKVYCVLIYNKLFFTYTVICIKYWVLFWLNHFLLYMLSSDTYRKHVN